jgi:hypothetical protein
MPETAWQTLKSRSESHSDVAQSDPAKAYQQALAERQFGEVLLKRLRETGGGIQLRNLNEEWVTVDDGVVFEITAEVQPLEQ